MPEISQHELDEKARVSQVPQAETTASTTNSKSAEGSFDDVDRDGDTSDSVLDAQLVRRIDLRLLPILTLLYLLSFLDRTNIGNARIIGLATDLNLSAPAYNTSLALYFVAYVIFEVPSNIILKRFDPQLWLPTLTLVWGIVTVCQGLVTNQAGLFGIRFCEPSSTYRLPRDLVLILIGPVQIVLGATEAGLFPGVIYLFSIYYLRRERRARVAIFFGGAALAGAFGGILAFAIGKMEGIGGRRGWQWIFILEGLLTIIISLLAYAIVPTWSYKAKFLTEPQRNRLLSRLDLDTDPAHIEPFQWVYVKQAFTDHLVWAYAFLFHGYAFALYSLSLFMPTIITELGFQTWQAQLLTVPPNALAALSITLTVWLSIRRDRRAVFIIGAAVVAIIGYIVLLTAPKPGAQYVGVHLAAAGVYTGNALLLSWPGENVVGQTKRAVAVAMQITFGDIGAIAGVLIYRPNFAQHQYRKPHIIAIGYLLFAIAVAAYLRLELASENRRKDALVADSQSTQKPSDTIQDQQRLGDHHMVYRYVY
ncbi:major facilitator superfamily domain-containing protein [Lentinula raphanica]|nr:major facilitator superfamily domain-containing protein [Lentinula raphanica]